MPKLRCDVRDGVKSLKREEDINVAANQIMTIPLNNTLLEGNFVYISDECANERQKRR